MDPRDALPGGDTLIVDRTSVVASFVNFVRPMTVGS